MACIGRTLAKLSAAKSDPVPNWISPLRASQTIKQTSKRIGHLRAATCNRLPADSCKENNQPDTGGTLRVARCFKSVPLRQGNCLDATSFGCGGGGHLKRAQRRKRNKANLLSLLLGGIRNAHKHKQLLRRRRRRKARQTSVWRCPTAASVNSGRAKLTTQLFAVPPPPLIR